MDAPERRLAAVLNADVVGFARLMSSDDLETVRTVQAVRDEVAALVHAQRGRLVDFVGDSLLAELPSALHGVLCAISLQQALEARNSRLPPERKLQLRIGVAVGDIIPDETRIYGDTVNVAARLQSLAVTGGICVSGALHEQVHRQLDESFEDLGMRWLKNLPDPVHVFRVHPGTRTEATEREALGQADHAERRLAGLLACDGSGYTRMSEQDERRAFETLVGFQKSLPPLIQQHRGRVVDAVADGLFAEFRTATDAVSCALAIQARVAEQNGQVPEPARLAFRVAVHVDEVIVRGDHLYGHGVILVHRLAAAAPAGEIYLSQGAWDRIEGKLAVGVEALGELTLGGTTRSLRAYRLKQAP